MTHQELESYFGKLKRVAGDKLGKELTTTHSTVTDYYSKSAFYYKKFHSPEGAMHLPISFSNKDSHLYKLRYQADTVKQIIQENKYTSVLELGCGMGFNSRYLAENLPEVEFEAVDITVQNIEFASKKAEALKNVSFRYGDFDNLQIDPKKYDLIFAVETLCHSKGLKSLINAAADKLNPNGRIVIFDGYEKEKGGELSDIAEKEAYKLLCWGFALDKFQQLEEITDESNYPHLEMEELTEFSENVLPNMIVFQNGSKNTLKYPLLLKLLLNLRIVPMALVKQLSAGLFGSYFIQSGFLGYYKVVLRKME